MLIIISVFYENNVLPISYLFLRTSKLHIDEDYYEADLEEKIN